MRGCSNIPKMLQRCTIAQLVRGGKSGRKLLNIDRCKYRPTRYHCIRHVCGDVSCRTETVNKKFKKSLVFLSFWRCVFKSPFATHSQAFKKVIFSTVTETCSSFFSFLLPSDTPYNTGERVQPRDSEVSPLPFIVAEGLRGPDGFDDPVDELPEEDDDKHAVVSTSGTIDAVISTHVALGAARVYGRERIVHTFHWQFSFGCEVGSTLEPALRSRGQGRFLRSENKVARHANWVQAPHAPVWLTRSRCGWKPAWEE